MRDLFGIALVHLAAVGFDEKFRHRESGIVTQTGTTRHNELNERRGSGDRHPRRERTLTDGRRGGCDGAHRRGAVRRSPRREHRWTLAGAAGLLSAATWT